MNNKRVVVTTFLPVAFAACIYAQDWPQYLGPNKNSTSPQKGILRTWPASGPEVLWTVNVGPGFGGSVIKDDKTGDIMRCFDFKTGIELWKFSYDAPGSVPFPGSRSMPIIDGNYVYSCGHNGDVYCFDINTHKPVWKKNVWMDFGGGRIPMFGVTQCPLVYGDLLILASQAPEAGVVAYEKLTGNVKWKTPPLGPVGYVSSTIVKDGYFFSQYSTNDRRDGLVCMSMDGKIMWKTGPSPLFDKGGMILVDGLLLGTFSAL